MSYTPKEVPEHVNVTPVHPLVNFLYLVGTVITFSALVYWLLGLVAAQLIIRISPEMEARIGQQLIATVETSKPQQQEYLEELLASLHEPQTISVPLTLHVVDYEQPNAAVLPGGHILLTEGLLKQAESENELAFVLAHELGHIVARDSLRGLGRSLVLLTVTSALGFGTGGSPPSGLVTLTGQLTDLHYSRQQETAADLYALTALIRVYGHGGYGLDFFARTQKEDKGKLGLFSTHPLTQQRLDYLRKVAREREWKMTGKATDLPASFE
ncbi:MAG: M48 family metallopeptidase [Cyanophyceae cyanobacterium]